MKRYLIGLNVNDSSSNYYYENGIDFSERNGGYLIDYCHLDLEYMEELLYDL